MLTAIERIKALVVAGITVNMSPSGRGEVSVSVFDLRLGAQSIVAFEFGPFDETVERAIGIAERHMVLERGDAEV